MNTIKMLLLIILGNAVCNTAKAESIKGRIVDDASQPVAFANVILLDQKDSTFIEGTLSDENGTFSIETTLSDGVLKISCIGYSTQFIKIRNTNINNIRLSPKTQDLGEVVVKANKKTIKMIPGGMKVDIKNSLLSDAGNAIDLFSELPRVNVSVSGEISVFGKGTPEIYINGRKLRSKDELQQLSSKDIESIEVITAPGAKYDAERGAVINIKTIRRLGDFLSVFATSRTSYSNDYSCNLGTSFTYRKNGVEFNFYPNYRNSHSAESNDFTTNLKLSDYTLNTIQHGEFSDRTQSFAPSSKLCYDINKNHSVGASVQLSKLINYKGEMLSDYSVLHNSQPQGTVSQKSQYDWDRNFSNMNVYYTGHIRRLDIQVDGSYVHSKVNRNQQTEETSLQFDDRHVNTFSTQNSHLYAGKAMATYFLSKGGLVFGTEISSSHIDSELHNQEGYFEDSDNNIQERNQAGFVAYSANFEHFSIGAGLRYEKIKSDYYSHGILDPMCSRRYDDLFPNISASWNKDNWGLQFSYAKKIKRPSYSQLRSYQQYDNRYTYESGNPNLQPSVNHDVEISSMWKWVCLSLNYTYSHDNILWKNDIYGTEAAYSHYININHKQDISAVLILQPKFNWYQPQITIAYWQQFFNARKYGFLKTLNRPEIGININNKFIFNKTSWISLQGIYDNAHDVGTQEQSSIVIVNARAYKSFSKGQFAINLYANDILNSNREKWNMRTHDIEINKDCDNFARSIELQFTYRFNSTRSKYKGAGAGNEEKNRLR